MQLGNGHWESTTYNSRSQPTRIALGTTPGATDKLKLNYGYGSTSNNGNVLTQTITVTRAGQSDLVFDENYAYDSLNRLQVAEEKTGTTTNWKQTFTFDRYGNRNLDQANTTFPDSFANTSLTNPSFNASNNKFASGQSWNYDAAGNVTGDPTGNAFDFDGENKQVKVRNSSSSVIGEYFFDGEGRRVKKVTQSETTIFVYDVGGKLVAEYSTNTTPQNEAKVNYLSEDNLSTPRINTDENGNVTARHDYMPFGEEVVALGGRSEDDKYVADGVRQGFTGYINDDETGLEFAKARMYAKSYGRFASIDPMGLKKALLENPQNLNRYVYTRNNPINYVDSDGHCSVPAGLQKGQVGICVEAFIAAKNIRGVGQGDNRTFEPNNPDASARMRVTFVVSTNATSVDISTRESLVNVSRAAIETPLGAATPKTGEIGVGLPAKGEISVSGSNNVPAGSDGFGNGLSTSTNIRVVFQNGTNGGSVLGENLETAGVALGNTAAGTAATIVGHIAASLSPVGTIDVNAQIRISGSGSDIRVTGTAQTRPFPSVAGYAYTVNDDGSIRTTELFRQQETKIDDLTKPVRPIN